MHILSARKCFSSLAEVRNSHLVFFLAHFLFDIKLIFAVLQTPCDDILDVVIAVIERYMNIWAAMDIVNEIGEELFKKHQALRLEHKRCRSLFTLLSSLSSAGCLAESAHHQIESEVMFDAQVSLGDMHGRWIKPERATVSTSPNRWNDTSLSFTSTNNGPHARNFGRTSG